MINWQLSKQGIRWVVLLIESWAQVLTHQGQYFLKLSADKLLVFKRSQAQVYIFFKVIWNMLCLCAAQLKFWFQTDLGCENSASYARKTVAFNHPSAPQENQCLLSHFLTTLGAQEKTDCSSMLWSIVDNIHGSIVICQNKVSAGWPPDRIAGSGVNPSRSSTFLKLSADKLLVFKWSQAQVYFFQKSYEKCCVYVTMAPNY